MLKKDDLRLDFAEQLVMLTKIKCASNYVYFWT